VKCGGGGRAIPKAGIPAETPRGVCCDLPVYFPGHFPGIFFPAVCRGAFPPAWKTFCFFLAKYPAELNHHLEALEFFVKIASPLRSWKKKPEFRNSILHCLVSLFSLGKTALKLALTPEGGAELVFQATAKGQVPWCNPFDAPIVLVAAGLFSQAAELTFRPR